MDAGNVTRLTILLTKLLYETLLQSNDSHRLIARLLRFVVHAA